MFGSLDSWPFASLQFIHLSTSEKTSDLSDYETPHHWLSQTPPSAPWQKYFKLLDQSYEIILKKMDVAISLFHPSFV